MEKPQPENLASMPPDLDSEPINPSADNATGDKTVIPNVEEVSQPTQNSETEGLAAVWVDPHSGAELPLFDGVLPPPPDAADGEDSADDSSLEDGSLDGASQEGGGSVQEPTHEGEEADTESLKSSASRSLPSLRSIGRLTIFANKFKNQSPEGNDGTSEVPNFSTETADTFPPKATTPNSNLSKASTKEGGSVGKKPGAKDSWSGSLFGGGKSTSSKPTRKGHHDQRKKAPATPEEPPILGPSELCVVLVEARALEHPNRAQQLGGAGSSGSSEEERPVSCSVVLQCNDQVSRSAVVHGTRFPVWQQSFRFLVSNPRKAITLTVEHHDPLQGDEIVGSCSIPLKNLGVMHRPEAPPPTDSNQAPLEGGGKAAHESRSPSASSQGIATTDGVATHNEPPPRCDVVQWFDLFPVPKPKPPGAEEDDNDDNGGDHGGRGGGGIIMGSLRVGLRWRPSARSAKEAQANHDALLMPPPSSEPPIDPVEVARAATHSEVMARPLELPRGLFGSKLAVATTAAEAKRAAAADAEALAAAQAAEEAVVPSPNQLTVRLVRARNLPCAKVKVARRNGETCNPIATVKLTGSEQVSHHGSRQSTVKVHRLDPIFEDIFQFPCRAPPAIGSRAWRRRKQKEEAAKKSMFKRAPPPYQAPVLEITIEDDDKEAANEVLGLLQLPLIVLETESKELSSKKKETNAAKAPPAPSRFGSKKKDATESSSHNSNRGSTAQASEDESPKLVHDWRRALLEGQRPVRQWWPLEKAAASTNSGGIGGAFGSLFSGSSNKKKKEAAAAATAKEGAEEVPEVLVELRWAFNEDLVESEDEESDDDDDEQGNALTLSNIEVLEGDALTSLQAEALDKCRALVAAWTKLKLVPDPALHSRSLLDGSALMSLLQGDAQASKAAKVQANRRHEVAATAMKATRKQQASSSSSRTAASKEARDKSGNANNEDVVRIKAHVVSAEGLVALDKGGTSDPYITLELVQMPEAPASYASASEEALNLTPLPKQPKHKTATAKKTLSPQWDEKFEWELKPQQQPSSTSSSSSSSSSRAIEAPFAKVGLRLMLADADLLSNESLGTLLVPLQDPTGAPGARLVSSEEGVRGGGSKSKPKKSPPPSNSNNELPPTLTSGSEVDFWVPVSGMAGSKPKQQLASGKVRLKLSAELPAPPSISESEAPEREEDIAPLVDPPYFEEYDVSASGRTLGVTPGEPNLLLVAMVRARGLMAMDTNLFGGPATSDPVAKLKLSQQESGAKSGKKKKGKKGISSKEMWSTTIVKETLTPEWHNVFELPVNFDPNACLDIQVEDWDLVGANDFLGQVRLPLAGLGAHRKTHRAWHKLQPRSTNGRPVTAAKPNSKNKKKHNKSDDGTAATAAGSDCNNSDDPYGRGEVFVCLRWIHDGERERELLLRQKALDLLLKRPVQINPSPPPYSEGDASSLVPVAAAAGGGAALAKQNREQQRLVKSGNNNDSSSSSSSSSEPYDKVEAQAAVQRASVLASMWCRVAALALARHVRTKAPFPEANFRPLPGGGKAPTNVVSPSPPHVIGISSVFSELPLFVRPAVAVPLATRGVRSLATHADHFPLPGGTLAQKRAAAAARAADSATLTRKKRHHHHHKGGHATTGEGAAGSSGDGGGGGAAAMPVKPTAEEDAHAAASLARRVKAAQAEERRAARRTQNTNKHHHRHHHGGGGGSGPSRVKVAREAPPPDPQRWLLKPLPFTLEAKAHLMPILSCLAGQDLARVETCSRLFYYPQPQLSFLSLAEAAARRATLTLLAAGVSAVAPGQEPPAVPLPAVTWKVALAAACQTAALTRLYMATEGWVWRRRDFWGVGPDAEPGYREMRQAKAVKAAAKAALKARGGGTHSDGDDRENTSTNKKKKSQGKATTTGGNIKKGNQNDASDDDDDEDEEVTFRMASVSGFRAAAGIDVTPFSASKGRAGRALSSKGAMSDAQRLKRMYGVTCGNDADGDGLADDTEESNANSEEAPAATTPAASDTTRGGSGRDSLAVPMADRGLAKPKEMVAKKGSTELEQKRLEMDALRNLVLERLYAIDVAPLHKEEDDDDQDKESTGAGGVENGNKENEASEAATAAVFAAASSADENDDEGSTAAAAEVEETLIVTRIVLRSNGLRKRLPDCFHGLRSLINLDLSGNGAALGGPIPRSIGELEVLRALNLAKNRFTGTIPDVLFSRLRSLELLDLSTNQLSGHLPVFDWSWYESHSAVDHHSGSNGKTAASGSSHQHKESRGNTLPDIDGAHNSGTSGADPLINGGNSNHHDDNAKVVHPLSNLALLNCAKNNLSGPLPSWLRTLPAIRVIELQCNRFSGDLNPLFLPPLLPPTTHLDLHNFEAGSGEDLGLPLDYLGNVEHGSYRDNALEINSVHGDETHWDATTAESHRASILESPRDDGGVSTDNKSYVSQTSQGTTMTPSSAPPLLLDYIRTVFHEHDINNDGHLHWSELWWLFKGLGIGLTDAEIGQMQADANAQGLTSVNSADEHGHHENTIAEHNALAFDTFAPIALSLLKRTFDSRQWGRVNAGHNPWVRLYDNVTECFYYHHLLSGTSEWVTGTPEQAARVGTPLAVHKESRRSQRRAIGERLTNDQSSRFAGGLVRPDAPRAPRTLPPIPLAGRPFLVTLRKLNLGSNALTGTIPSSVGHLRGLVALNLSGNHLSGDVPLGSLAYAKDLRQVVLHGNRKLTVPTEVHAVIDLSKPLGATLDQTATVVAVAPLKSDDPARAPTASSPVRKPSKPVASQVRVNDDNDDGAELDAAAALALRVALRVPPDRGGPQGGLSVGCRLVAVGDVSVNTSEEVANALDRWRVQDEPVCPITFVQALRGHTEEGVGASLAPGQESRVRVEAAEARFHPSQWTDKAVSGADASGAAFEALQQRLPGLLQVRTPGSLLDKKWDLKSAAVALGIDSPREPA